MGFSDQLDIGMLKEVKVRQGKECHIIEGLECWVVNSEFLIDNWELLRTSDLRSEKNSLGFTQHRCVCFPQ